MNPIGTESRIRALEAIVTSPTPHLSQNKVVQVKSPEFVFERYVVSADGKMSVERPTLTPIKREEV